MIWKLKYICLILYSVFIFSKLKSENFVSDIVQICIKSYGFQLLLHIQFSQNSNKKNVKVIRKRIIFKVIRMFNNVNFWTIYPTNNDNHIILKKLKTIIR